MEKAKTPSSLYESSLVLVHASHNTCYTNFIIWGDFNPDEITELLGLKPYEISRKGDKAKSGRINQISSWKFGYNDNYTWDVNKQILQTITPLLNKISLLKDLKLRYNADFFLEVVPTIRFDEPTPCLAPSQEVMAFCCATDTKLDIDLYISTPDDYKGNNPAWEQ